MFTLYKLTEAPSPCRCTFQEKLFATVSSFYRWTTTNPI